MRIAIMQPYIFPYVGYFQLMRAVERFICLDDVAFITRGWINRNRLLSNGRPGWFTVPLVKASQNRDIDATLVHQAVYAGWREKFFRRLEANYGRAPYYIEGRQLAEAVFTSQSGGISEMAFRSLSLVCGLCGINTEIVPHSRPLGHRECKGSDRLLALCHDAGADCYINAPGGRALYAPNYFARHGVRLLFLDPCLRPYAQGTGLFQPGLSILDTIMHCGPEGTAALCREYDLE